MHLDRLVHFLTLVLCFVTCTGLAAPVAEIQNPLIPVEPQNNDPYLQMIRNRQLKSSWNFGVDKINGILNKDKANEDTWGLSASYTQYENPKVSDVAKTYQLNAISIGLLSLSYDQKWIFHDIHPTDPTLIAGVRGIYDAKDQFANLIDYQRYFIFAGIGLQNLFQDHRLYQCELTGAYGTLGSHIDLRLTFAFSNEHN